MKIDTPDGKNLLHGTIIVAYQEQKENTTQQTLQLDRSNHTRNSNDPRYKIDYFPEPLRQNFNYKNHSCSVNDLNHNDDLVWALLKTCSKGSIQNIPTWAAYNSALSKKTSVTTISTLPLISGSPTDWSNLTSALKVTRDLSNLINDDQKIVVSLDLQLYSKCIQLQEQNTLCKNFIFRMGELHVVITVLKVLGKIIHGSGMDQCFEGAGIYGNATLSQMKEGKHLYQALEAHFVL